MITVRQHGNSGPPVIVLHGGPAAAGEAAPIARGLADAFCVLEPWQRGSGEIALTVATHVADLHEVVCSIPGQRLAALVGESWGAMLALAYAAAHPQTAGPLALIGCGTFDTRSRAILQATLESRKTDAMREQLDRLAINCTDPGQRAIAAQALMEPLYLYDPIPRSERESEPLPPFDLVAHEQTWRDMLRQQELGIYPAAFGTIRAPVLMIHGDYDPHPGHLVRDGLRPLMPQLEYHELARCGHSPWLERSARAEFFAILRRWLAERC